jgi:serine protease Do
VSSGSCAETAGLQVGDIITQVDGTDITTSAELIDAKNTHKAGEEMDLTVFRDSEYVTLRVTLDEEQPEDTTTTTDDSQSQSGQNSQGNSGNSYSYGYGYSWPYGFSGGW